MILILALVSFAATAQTTTIETVTSPVNEDSTVYITTEYKVNRRGYVKEMKVVRLETLDQDDKNLEENDPKPVVKKQETKEDKRVRVNNSVGGRLVAHVAQDMVLVGEAVLIGKLFR